jgi:hypothetical protein
MADARTSPVERAYQKAVALGLGISRSDVAALIMTAFADPGPAPAAGLPMGCQMDGGCDFPSGQDWHAQAPGTTEECSRCGRVRVRGYENVHYAEPEVPRG